ncbi:hypothetical protein ACXM0N_08535 [Peribacillus simplex]
MFIFGSGAGKGGFWKYEWIERESSTPKSFKNNERSIYKLTRGHLIYDGKYLFFPSNGLLARIKGPPRLVKTITATYLEAECDISCKQKPSL